MKKFIISFTVLAALATGVMLLTPLGKVFIDMGYFAKATIDYGRKETAAEKQIAGFSDADYAELVAKVAKLTSAYTPSNDMAADRHEAHECLPIPDSLAYLNPQRVWISAGYAQIELLHMMDADTTLFVERNAEGRWSISGHFGDYMNKTRVLWQEPVLSQSPLTAPQ